MNTNTINRYWDSFLKKYNLDPDTKYLDTLTFGFTEMLSSKLLELVYDRKKQATSSSQIELEREGIYPKIGDYYVVTDTLNNPKCIVRITNVIYMKFNEMTFEICKKEGEDDNLESWRKNHVEYFTEEGKILGYTFSDDMEIVFEEFELVHKFPK